MNRYLSLAAIIIATSLVLASCSSGGAGGGSGSTTYCVIDDSNECNASKLSAKQCSEKDGYLDIECPAGYDIKGGSSSGDKDNGVSYGTMSYKGQNYKTRQVGSVTWMAENLNYDVPTTTTDVCYGNNTKNCATYGRLYDRNSAVLACTDGWRLPKGNDLMAYLNTLSEGAQAQFMNSFFSQYGGYGDSNGRFYDIGNCGNWWSASILDANNSGGFHSAKSKSSDCSDEDKDEYLRSVRCVKD